ncbi:autotransporter outer membrane beta-barrel domain-containing protein [Microvirga sp. W0021]|uniref:Autotransporter outer membrane beta-barrel domain-containing protein n=1 Tax=Hohaiivirga grylli TaxID=3133970 RepID=A0ABV0BFF9_9HYPH
MFLKFYGYFLSFVTVIVFGLSFNTAIAQQIVVTEGQNIERDGGTYRNLNTNPANSSDAVAIFVSGTAGNEAVFKGSNLTLLAAAQNPVYLLPNIIAGSNSRVTLINTSMSEGLGILATGPDSIVTMNGGTISSANYAVEAVNSTVYLNNVDIDISNSMRGGLLFPQYGYVRGISTADGASVYLTDGTMTVFSEHSRSVGITNAGTLHLDGTTINMTGGDAAVQSSRLTPVTDENDISLRMQNFSITTLASPEAGKIPNGIFVHENGRVQLNNGVVETLGDPNNNSGPGYALYVSAATVGSTVLNGDQLTLITTGLMADAIYLESNAVVNLTNTDITTGASFTNGLKVADYGTLNLTNGSITLNGSESVAAYAQDNANIKLDNVDVISPANWITAAYASNGSKITIDTSRINLPAETAVGAYATNNSTINLNNTTLRLSGQYTEGLYSGGLSSVNIFNISGSTISVPNNAVFRDEHNSTETFISLTNSSSLSGINVLEVAGKLSLIADNSRLTGGATVASNATMNMNLQNGSEWVINGPNSSPPSSPFAGSTVSTLSVTDSIITFVMSSPEDYHALLVGEGVVTDPSASVYQASGAILRMNTRLDEGWPYQWTDRVLIKGSVSGQTLVIIQPVLGSQGAATDVTPNSASNGISIIQVAGDAREDSFKLLGGYVTAVGSPYQYSLYAYGPGSSNGLPDDNQRTVPGRVSWWDYRLQSVYVEPVIPPVDPGVTDPQHPSTGGGNGGGGAIIIPERVRAVAPQVANYLIAPTALFHAGLQDMSSLHQRLGEIRDDRLTGRNSGTGEFFIRGYGGVYNYKSNRNAYRYGYDADINYAAMQMGGSLYALETQEGILRLGVAGTVGTVSFDPKNVNGTNSTRLDKWSVSAFATYLHNSGFYVDGILSYGAFDGNVSTTYRGKTASLSGQTFSASLEMGYPIHFLNGVVLEPQAQVVYQRLMFDRKLDVDMFEVRLGDIDQVTARVGARLSKTYTQSADSLITVYAKANMLHTFNNSNKVYLGDTFRIGDFGTSIEGGLGVNATVSKNLSVYGDVAYQHRVGKSGVSGVSLTGGLRYSF